MPKSKKESYEKTMYFSPKKGEMKEYKVGKKEPFKRAVDALAKAKSKTINITEDCMYAQAGPHTQILSYTELGIRGTVTTRELKAVAKVVEEPFSVTYQDGTLKFSWGEGNYDEIGITAPEEPEWTFNHDFSSKEEGLDSFAASLFMGGAAVATKHSVEKLKFIECDSKAIRSTDTVLLAEISSTEYPFTFSADSYELWCKLDLPLKNLRHNPKGMSLLLEDNIEIWDLRRDGPQPDETLELPFKAVLDRLRNVSHGHQTKFPTKMWETIKQLKDCEDIYFENGTIGTVSGLKFNVKNFQPFPEGCSDRFCCNTKSFLRLKPLITGDSNLTFLALPIADQIQSFLLVEPEPGMDGTILLAGISTLKETN